MALAEHLAEALAREREIFGAPQLDDDASRSRSGAAVEQPLREPDVHGNEIVVQLPRCLRLGAADEHVHHVGCPAGRRGEEVYPRQVVVRGRLGWALGLGEAGEIDRERGTVRARLLRTRRASV